MTPTAWLWSITALLFGLNIGSFLNVVIWRIPRGGSLLSPKFSYCPHCNRQLTPAELIPLFSFLLLGRRCRTCKQPISWRYFTVELITGLLFLGLALRFQASPTDAVFLMLFTAILVPMTFIDIDFFAIPDQLNLLAFLLAIVWDAWGIAHHEANHALVWGWLPRSILGAVWGVLVFGSVRVAGWIWKRVEAMGLGDVLLARAMGAMLLQMVPVGQPLWRLFPSWVLLSCVAGMVVGIPTIIFRAKRDQTVSKRGNGEVEVEQKLLEDDEEIGSLAGELREIGFCLMLGDLVEFVRDKRAAARGESSSAPPEPTIAEEDFTPAPTAIPFGPFLAIGFLATVFVGEFLTSSYIAWALPKQ